MTSKIRASEWRPAKLDELGSVGRGRSKHRPRNDPALYGGPYPFIQTGDISGCDIYITSHSQTYSELGLAQSKMWPAGTVCIVNAGENTGETGILTFSACFPDSVIAFQADPQRSDARFVNYSLRLMKAKWRSVTKGATQDNLSVEKLLSFPLAVPSLSTQQRIASILSAYDDLIENNTKRIKILEEMARSLYREWFVHFRFPGHEKVKIVDSALGKVPDGWPLARLDQMYQTASGGTPSRKRPEYFAASGSGIPWVKTKELFDRWILSTEEDISQEGLNSSSARVFPANTLLVAMYGATIGQLGLLSVPSATNQACCAILPAKEKSAFGPYWAWCYFLENRARIAALGLGAAQPNISQVVIRGLELIKPPSELAARFEEAVTPVFESTRNLQAKNWSLQRTRDLLLPRLISSEIDVSKLELPT